MTRKWKIGEHLTFENKVAGEGQCSESNHKVFVALLKILFLQ